MTIALNVSASAARVADATRALLGGSDLQPGSLLFSAQLFVLSALVCASAWMLIVCVSAALALAFKLCKLLAVISWTVCAAAYYAVLCLVCPKLAIAKSRESLVALLRLPEKLPILGAPEAAQVAAQVAAGVQTYVLSETFTALIKQHVEIALADRGSAERHFASQEKTREDLAWLRLYAENRKSLCDLRKIRQMISVSAEALEKTRVAGFELAYGRPEAAWTVDDRIHFAKRLVADIFESENLPADLGEVDDAEEHTQYRTHVNPVVLCGRIYVETIDNWNNREHFDPAAYISIEVQSEIEPIKGAAWLELHEADRALRRARLSEEAQFAMDLADAIEGDRVAARDLAVGNTRTLRSGKTYVC